MSPSLCPWLPDTLQQARAPLRPQSLPVLLHGRGSNAQNMAVLMQALCPAMPGALVAQGFEPVSMQPGVGQWFQRTALRFLLGAADPQISAEQARSSMERLRALGGESTLDLAAGLGHGIGAALLDAAARRLA